MNDATIIASLKSFDRRTLDNALRFLLENTDMRSIAESLTRRYDRNDGLYMAIFEEAYADAVIDFYERIDQFNPDKSAITSTIVRFARINFYTAYRAEQRQNQRNLNAAAMTAATENPEAVYLEKDKYARALEILAQLGDSCKELLLMWYEKFSFEDMAKALHRPSADAAKQATYGCRAKLNKYLSDHPDYIQSF